jgi:uncharacterized RDD family membrane protein YckC
MVATHRADQEFAVLDGVGEVPLATYGGRLLARLIDFLIIFVLTYFPFLFFLPDGLLVQVAAVLVTFLLYDTILTANTGATPGKRLTRVKIVRVTTGTAPGWGRSLRRALILTLLGWLIIAVTALFDERRHRGWHDRVAGTVVIAV